MRRRSARRRLRGNRLRCRPLGSDWREVLVAGSTLFLVRQLFCVFTNCQCCLSRGRIYPYNCPSAGGVSQQPIFDQIVSSYERKWILVEKKGAGCAFLRAFARGTPFASCFANSHGYVNLFASVRGRGCFISLVEFFVCKQHDFLAVGEQNRTSLFDLPIPIHLVQSASLPLCSESSRLV